VVAIGHGHLAMGVSSGCSGIDLVFERFQKMSETNKVGRPALLKKEKRWKFISTRISQDEYREIVQAAKESGIPKTKWVRTKLVAAARRA
jgi:hypothetical protein